MKPEIPLRGWRFWAVHLVLPLEFLLALYGSSSYAAFTLYTVGDMGQSPSHATWTSAVFFAGRGLGMFLAPFVSRRFRSVPSLLASCYGLSAVSFLCGLTGDFYLFLVLRLVLGFFSGTAMILAQFLTLRFHPPERWPNVITGFGLLLGSTFAFGPNVGGVLEEAVGWRGFFFIAALLHLFLGGLLWAVLPRRREEPVPYRFDGVGLGLLLISMLSLQTLIVRGQDEDWYNSTFVVALAAAGVLSLVAFAIWELGEKEPLIDVRIFLQPHYTIGVLAGSTLLLLAFGMLSLLLGNLQTLEGYTPDLAARSMLSVFLLAPAGWILATYLNRHVDPRWPSAFYLAGFAAYAYWVSTYDYFGRRSWYTYLLGSQVLQGFCLGGVATLTAVALQGTPRHRESAASQTLVLVRTYAMSWGPGLLGALLTHRTAFQQTRLVETAPWGDPAFGWAADRLLQTGASPLQAIGLLGRYAASHAAILATEDVFRFCSWCFLGLAILVCTPLAKKRPPSS
ncbi:Inner membrane component of tripartite multidrug resistance system [Methylacidimicrobium sp. AP8]|uniref:MFS transporter n=1 Tax=Methylacidimicrobium sp. AP8 TaxID=2730359 RepID=UPI0018BFB30C|nr:MFS transporter [Methylacidimicrobium sp. AP8]CAB4243894.1 Inner membrane component of tripartite multidrug resistance system [Methylacidimicrobium sp. AP8]